MVNMEIAATNFRGRHSLIVGRSALLVLALVTTAFLTFRLTWIGHYPLTIAPFSVVLLLLLLIRVRLTLRTLLLLCIAAAYPILVFCVNAFFLGGVGTSPASFAQSYALWFANISAFILGTTLPTRWQIDLAPPAFICLALLCFIGLAQWLIGNVLGHASEIVFFGSRQYTGGWAATPHFTSNDVLRAPGFYYEPSMFGRVAMSFAAICAMSRHHPLATIIMAALIVATTQSPSAGILYAVVLGFLFSNEEAAFTPRFRAVFWMLLLGSLVYAFRDRFLEVFSGADAPTSSSIRIYLSFLVVSEALLHFPLGVALSVNESLASTTAAFQFVEEAKITNGIYELFLYTGFPGLGLVAGLVIWALTSFRRGNWTRGWLILFVLLSPIASSSFLSFEGNFVLIAVLLHYRMVSQRQRQAHVIRDRQ